MTSGTTSTTTAWRQPGTPARRLTLAAGVPVVLVLIAGAVFGAVAGLASASYPVRYAFPSGSGPLTTQLGNSTLTLRPAAVSAPVLSGTAHYTLFRSAFTHSGDTARYHCPWSVGGCKLNATLKVPAASPVSLSTHGGDVAIPSFTRAITLNTSGGDLTAGALSGALNLDTRGGDATVTRLTGPPANLNSGGGDITVQAMATSGTVDSQGGDVTVHTLATTGTTTVDSQGGDVTVRALATPGTTTMDSSGGDVIVTAATAPANLQITSAGGDVTIVLPHGSYDFNSNAAGGDLSQPASNRDAQNKITVQSGGGDITIKEAS